MVDSSIQKAQAWRKRILNQRSSGKTIRYWCQANGCQEHAFYWWRTRLGLSPTSDAARRAPVVGFAEVVVDDKPVATMEPMGSMGSMESMEPTGPMTLRLRSGHELVLPSAMPVEQVAKLIRAIEASAPAPTPVLASGPGVSA